jgi:hypothetical protein
LAERQPLLLAEKEDTLTTEEFIQFCKKVQDMAEFRILVKAVALGLSKDHRNVDGKTAVEILLGFREQNSDSGTDATLVPLVSFGKYPTPRARTVLEEFVKGLQQSPQPDQHVNCRSTMESVDAHDDSEAQTAITFLLYDVSRARKQDGVDGIALYLSEPIRRVKPLDDDVREQLKKKGADSDD